MGKHLVFFICLSALLIATSFSMSLEKIWPDESVDSDELEQMLLQQAEKRSVKAAKRVTADEKLQKMTLALIKYMQFLKSNQLDSNMKKVIILQLNELVDEMQRHLAEHPELSHSIAKMIKNPAMLFNSGDMGGAGSGDDAKNNGTPDVTPFKWG